MQLKYDLIKEYDDYDIFFEPITDTIDGFVIRSKEGYILKIYSEDK